MRFILILLMLPTSLFADVLSDFDQCRFQCSEQCIQKARGTKKMANAYIRKCLGDTGGGGQHGNNVLIYRSDSCSGSIIASLNERSNCSQFSNSGSDAWAVEVNGTCTNISDMSIQAACIRFAGAGPRSAEIYRSDSCSGEMNAVVNRWTDCSALPSSGSDAWAVRIDGKCQDISDMSVQAACTRFKSRGPKVFRSDNCSGSMIMRLGRGLDCSTLPSNGSDAWAIEVNGKCEDISDMSLQNACNSFSADSQDATVIYRNDSCNGSLIALIDRDTDCSRLPSTGSDAWAVRINGRCENISDTNVQQACRNFGGR